MKSRIGKTLLVFLMLILYTSILEAGEFVTSTGKTIQFLSPYEVKEFNPVEEQKVKPGELNPDTQDITPCLIALPDNSPDYYDLKQYQTSVKDQNPRGSCAAFAWVGAMEAAYKRKYGLELNLSEEYFIHIAHSVQHSYNPNLLHPYENIASYCSLVIGDPNNPQWENYDPVRVGNGSIVMVTEGLTIPKEKYAPYFGNIYDGSTIYPSHSDSDLVKIAADANIILKDSNGNPICNPGKTQQDIDNFEYDPRHIPLEARKNAIYGVTDMLYLGINKYRDTDILEKFIYSGSEISMGFTITHLDCSGKYSDGNAICTEKLNGCGLGGCGGHQMLLVGYDRMNQLFLFKNSWGSTSPYAWIAYDYIKKYANNGVVIRDVRDSNLGPPEEAMWIGKWDMDHDGWLGDLIIRRARKTKFETVTLNNDFTCISYMPSSDQERLGTYYGNDGVAHEVKGRINSETKDIELYIDLVHPEPLPYGKDYTVTINPGDQQFELELFTGGANSYTFGNFAAGLTTWSGIDFGALINRPDIEVKHSPSNFSIDKWKDKFKLYFSDGSKATLEITNIGSLSLLGYPVMFKYNGTSGTGFISNPDVHHFVSSSLGLDLYYHTREAGILSGLGVFGRRTSDIGVTEVSATDGTYSDKVQITWAPLQGAKLYVVYMSTSPSGTKENLSGQIKTTKLDHKTAVPGQVYYYWVVAVGEDGDWTDWSEYDSGYRKLAAPTGVVASDGTYTDKVLITWKPVQGGVLFYTVSRTEGGPPGIYKVLGSTDTTSFNDTTAIPGLQYSYSVKADSFYGSSDFSKSDKGYRKLAPPTNVVASDADAPLLMDKVQIQWYGVPGATSYTVYRRAQSQIKPQQKSLGTTSTTTFFDTTGIPELIYDYYVRASNAYGSSDYSAPDAGHRKLPAPTGVSASDGTYADKVIITWNSVDGASSYQIFRADDLFATRTLLGTAPAKSATPSFNDITANPGSFYFYWVKSLNKNGASDYSDKWDTGYRKLQVPTGISASDGTYPDKVRITWNPVQGAAQYLIYRSDSGSGGQVNIGGSVTTTYDDTSASPGTTYYYWVRALWSFMGSTSDYSSPDAGWCAVQTPSPPTLLSPPNGAIGVSTNTILVWSPSTGATSYRLEVSTSSSFSATVFAQGGIAGTSQPLSGLLNSTTYYWRVNATNGAGTSNWSSVWNFTTVPATPTPPAAPTPSSPVDGATGVSTNPTLSWNASSGATSYQIQVSTDSNFRTTVFNQSGITGTSQVVNGLHGGVLHYWRVNATNTAGTSQWSDVWSFTTGRL